MGTTMSVTDFRNKLKKFVDPNDNDVLEWPVYNNPLVKDTNLKDPDRRKYPNAGIRVPSALAVFNFYMNPSFFRIGKDQLEPEMLPYNSNNPGNPPSRVDTMMNEWRECTKIGANCPDAEVYRKMDAIFVENYNAYLSKNCEVPDYLKPVSGTAPRQRPKLTTFLRYVHGWVPFNNACPGVPQLPTIEKSRATRDYINLQYNYEKRESEKRWFNPYTHLGHAPKAQGGLSANAYAFSIDDQSSFQSNGGGTLPGGLIIAVGGPKGLKNGQQMPPPIPDPVPRWDFQVDLGGSANDTVKWAKYGICRADANMAFPPKADNAFSIGIDPADRNINAANPCPITLEDSKGRKYIIAVKKATPPGEQNPPKPIWPKWDGDGPGGLLDSSVVGCPARSGFVAPAQWCNFAKEFAVPQGQTVRGIPGPKFTIIGRGPLQN